MELTVAEECQESQEARVTVDSMGCLVSLERRGTGESTVLLAPQDPQEMMAPEVKMERSDRGVLLEKAVQEVCWVLEGLLVLQDSEVYLDWMANLVPKETWVHKEREGLTDSRGSLDHKVWSVLKALLVPLVKKDLTVARDWLVWAVLTALLVTLERKDHQERKEVLVMLDQ